TLSIINAATTAAAHLRMNFFRMLVSFSLRLPQPLFSVEDPGARTSPCRPVAARGRVRSEQAPLLREGEDFKGNSTPSLGGTADHKSSGALGARPLIAFFLQRLREAASSRVYRGMPLTVLPSSSPPPGPLSLLPSGRWTGSPA